MDKHIKKVYVPMTETAFLILFCLRKPNHGYGIIQLVEKMTDGAIRLTPGTMYGSLSKMEKDGVIRFLREEDKRKIYQITPGAGSLPRTGACRCIRRWRRLKVRCVPPPLPGHRPGARRSSSVRSGPPPHGGSPFVFHISFPFFPLMTQILPESAPPGTGVRTGR